MVRTLDFHSKNRGSSPLGPIITIPNKHKVTFSFVTPYSVNILDTNPSKIKSKINLKYLFLFISWFHFLASSFKNSNFSINHLPSKAIKFTHTKAPMAHKTRSKEQFQYKFFKFFANAYLNSPRLTINQFILINFSLNEASFADSNILFVRFFILKSALKFKSIFDE